MQTAGCRLHTVHCRLKTAYCRLKTAYCRLKTAYCILQTVYCILQTADCRLYNAERRLQTADFSGYHPRSHHQHKTLRKAKLLGCNTNYRKAAPVIEYQCKVMRTYVDTRYDTYVGVVLLLSSHTCTKTTLHRISAAAKAALPAVQQVNSHYILRG